MTTAGSYLEVKKPDIKSDVKETKITSKIKFTPDGTTFLAEVSPDIAKADLLAFLGKLAKNETIDDKVITGITIQNNLSLKSKDDDCIQLLGEVLRFNKQLTSVDLAKNDLSEHYFKLLIMQLINSSNQVLARLNLSSNLPRTPSDSTLLDRLVILIDGKQFLQELLLANNKFGTQNAIYFFVELSLTRRGYLKILDLASNEINHKAISALVKLGKFLNQLNLADNHFALATSENLVNLYNNVRDLNLSNCGMDDELTKMAAALTKPTLITFTLTGEDVKESKRGETKKSDQKEAKTEAKLQGSLVLNDNSLKKAAIKDFAKLVQRGIDVQISIPKHEEAIGPWIDFQRQNKKDEDILKIVAKEFMPRMEALRELAIKQLSQKIRRSKYKEIITKAIPKLKEAMTLEAFSVLLLQLKEDLVPLTTEDSDTIDKLLNGIDVEIPCFNLLKKTFPALANLQLPILVAEQKYSTQAQQAPQFSLGSQQSSRQQQVVESERKPLLQQHGRRHVPGSS